MEMKRGSQRYQKKDLSAPGLLKKVRTVFNSVPAPQRDSRGKKRQMSSSDLLMSALAMFGTKSPSLLEFDKSGRHEKAVIYNLEKLYGVNKVPSDTYMREELDEVDPENLRGAFLALFKAVQRGKVLERYQFMGKYLVSVDGTGVFSSDTVHCENCCKKNHQDGRATYHHQILGGVIVHPDQRQVVPLCPEPVRFQEGASKNDCERRAKQRFIPKLKEEHPRLEVIILGDALHSTAPQINQVKDYGYSFIYNVKPKSHKSLFEFIDGLDLDKKNVADGKNNYSFRYINDVPLNDTKNSPSVNFLECRFVATRRKKIIEKTFTWVTDLEITGDNVLLIMKGARARWKIENETFNTLKNQGNRFEHNFRRGKNNLNLIFSILMMLAFLIDQIQETSCGLFQAALRKKGYRKHLWEIIRGYFYICLLDSWENLFNAISKGIVANINSDTS